MFVSAATAPLAAFAQTNPFETAKNQLNTVGGAATGNATPKPLEQIIGSIINTVLGFLGILLLCYLLYAGFLWMTSGGSEDNVKKAQTMIKNAIIGLLIIVAAFAISSFVLTSLVNISR